MTKDLEERISVWLPAERVKEFVSLLEEILPTSPDPEGALIRLVQLAEASANPRWLFEYFLDDPANFEGLMVILGGSGFAARTLVLHPEYLEFLFDRGKLAQPKGLALLSRELKASLSPFRSTSSKWDALRRFRRRETIRIIAADLLHLMDFETLTAELSDLAEAILKAGLELLPPDDNFQVLVVAFGKLGARELNYSSDIDLVFFHEGYTPAAERWVRRYVSALTGTGHFGRLYRVDLRLRPYGSTGPLTIPLDAALAYYETKAEPGEKLALLKARPVAGGEELARRFEEFRRDFVFGNPIEPEEFAWLLRLKARSEATFAVEGSVKHGLGGIRDVEMTVQFLQLAFSSRFADLAVRDTLGALRKLRDRKLLTEREFAVLRDGYFFLRRLEHMLQIAEDLPLQALPSDERELNRLARCIGLTDGRSLLREFDLHTKQVRQTYETITSELAKTLGVSEQTMLSLSIASGLNFDEFALLAFNFHHPKEARKTLFRLVHGEATVGLSWRERVRIMRVLPLLLDALSKTPDPDNALMRLEGMLSAWGARHAVLDSLISNLFALRAIALVASVSEPLCQLATRHPEWLEGLLSGALSQIPDEEAIRREISSNVSQALSDLEKGWDTLSRIISWLKGKFTLLLGFMHICRLAPGEVIERTLSRLADILVGEVMLVLKELTGVEVSIFALGGWGSEELHFGSDLDVAFAHEGEQLAAERFVKKLRSMLGDLTGEGLAYRLDLRLRPTGQEGALSSDLRGWKEFTERRFEPWMALAWTRLRFAAGNPELGEVIVESVRRRLYERGLTPEQWEELRALLDRIRREHRPPKGVIDLKHSEGALWDIDLLVAEVQLREGKRCEALRRASVRSVLKELANFNPIWQQTLNAYQQLRQWRIWLSLVSPSSPPRFVRGDQIERLLAWLDANSLTQERLIPAEDALERWRQKWQELASLSSALKEAMGDDRL